MDNKPITGPPLKKLPKLGVSVKNWRDPSPEELKALDERERALSPEDSKRLAKRLRAWAEEKELSPEEQKNLEKTLKALDEKAGNPTPSSS